jgi:hypothetical protein
MGWQEAAFTAGLPLHLVDGFGKCNFAMMLYVIHMANHSEFAYRGGQEPIIHLEADLAEVVRWAEVAGRPWAFSLSNAGAYYTEFFNDLAYLGKVNWAAVAARDFRSPDVKEGKQAEFLVRESLPWALVRRVGVHSLLVGQQVTRVMAGAVHRPPVTIVPEWYY